MGAFKHEGDVLTHTNASGADISVDDVVPMGDCVGVALADIDNGDDGSVGVEGVFTAPKVSGTAWSQGDKLDYDLSELAFDKGISADSGDITSCAVAAKDADASDTEGEVRLTPGTGTAQA